MARLFAVDVVDCGELSGEDVQICFCLRLLVLVYWGLVDLGSTGKWTKREGKVD